MLNQGDGEWVPRESLSLPQQAERVSVDQWAAYGQAVVLWDTIQCVPAHENQDQKESVADEFLQKTPLIGGAGPILPVKTDL